MTRAAATPWSSGRLDARRGRARLLFGRMYEDPRIELAAFRGARRVFCIAAAGGTAIALAAAGHEVDAVDVNLRQVEYARRRLAGGAAESGLAERLLALARRLAPLAGWRRETLAEFLELEHPDAQLEFWRRRLDTRRFRAGFDALLSLAALRAIYSPRLLAFLPRPFGPVLRARIVRTIGLHPNRENGPLRALLTGEQPDPPAPIARERVTLHHAEAADFLERAPAGGYDGISLSNILDGADEAFARRLDAAVRRAARPGAQIVLRSFAEPGGDPRFERAAEERSPLWGVVSVRPVHGG